MAAEASDQQLRRAIESLSSEEARVVMGVLKETTRFLQGGPEPNYDLVPGLDSLTPEGETRVAKVINGVSEGIQVSMALHQINLPKTWQA